jgi:hypothetical protein
MKMRRISAFLAFVVVTFALVIALKTANAAPSETCFLIMTEHWPQSTKSDPKVMAQARSRLFDEIGILLDAAYRNGGYVRNPTSFPVHHTDFRDDHIVIDFRTPCARARLFLGELLQAYRHRLSDKQKAIGPELVIEDRSATKYEARCGVGATARTCPLN